MGQKVNPISLRLHYTNRHFDNCWYSNYFYKNLITRDIFLQHYLDNFLKLLKFPTGRYSIQYLQKKTQVYNFFCVSKSTREWRSQVFGLRKKNSLKKTRFFFKNTTASFFEKKKNILHLNSGAISTKYTKKLSSFYTTINQSTVHKIQKKINSFQNFKLWSKFLKKSINKKKINNLFPIPDFRVNTYENSNIFLSNLYFPVENHKLSLKLKNLFSKKFSIPRRKQDALLPPKKPRFLVEKAKKQISYNFQKKQHFGDLSSRRGDLSSLVFLSNKKTGGVFDNLYTNSNLFFWKNLFIYKIIKSNLKYKKTTNFTNQHNCNTQTGKRSQNVNIFLLDKKRNLCSRLFLCNKKRTHKKIYFLFSENSMNFQRKNTKIDNFMRMSNKIHFVKDKNNIFDKGENYFFFTKRNNIIKNNPLQLKYKNYIESSLSSLYKQEMDLYAFKILNDWQHANYLADEIIYFLEKRISFRRLKSKIYKQLSKIPQIRGVRITCSGRVGGKSKKAQRAKTECIKYGQTSLQVFSSKIDFSVKTAFTSFGSVGVKVWICYN